MLHDDRASGHRIALPVNREEIRAGYRGRDELPGATMEQYDEIVGKMGLTPGGATPPGAISHWVAKTNDGMRVVDVWESREGFDQFANREDLSPVGGGRYHRSAGDHLLQRSNHLAKA